MPSHRLNLDALNDIANRMSSMMGEQAQARAASDDVLASVSAKLDQVITILGEIRDNQGTTTDNDGIDIL